MMLSSSSTSLPRNFTINSFDVYVRKHGSHKIIDLLNHFKITICNESFNLYAYKCIHFEQYWHLLRANVMHWMSSWTFIPTVWWVLSQVNHSHPLNIGPNGISMTLWVTNRCLNTSFALIWTVKKVLLITLRRLHLHRSLLFVAVYRCFSRLFHVYLANKRMITFPFSFRCRSQSLWLSFIPKTNLKYFTALCLKNVWSNLQRILFFEIFIFSHAALLLTSSAWMCCFTFVCLRSCVFVCMCGSVCMSVFVP